MEDSTNKITTGDVVFAVGGSEPRELLRLCVDGRILVRGVETEKDKGLVDALRELIYETKLSTQESASEVCPNTERADAVRH